MHIGHDILIRVDEKIKPYIYDVLLSYIGNNNPKKVRGSAKKNGVAIVRENCTIDISNSKIKHWAETRRYFFKNTIVMDIDPSSVIFDALLMSLNKISDKKEAINNLLTVYFEAMKKNGEVYSKRLAILEDIYREILKDSNNNKESADFCKSLSAIETKYN